MFGRATITLGIGPHSIVDVWNNLQQNVTDTAINEWRKATESVAKGRAPGGGGSCHPCRYPASAAHGDHKVLLFGTDKQAGGLRRGHILQFNSIHLFTACYGAANKEA